MVVTTKCAAVARPVDRTINPWEQPHPTGGKTATNYTATVTAGARYYCVVRTFTPKHGAQQKNDLTSIDSAEVFVAPRRIR